MSKGRPVSKIHLSQEEFEKLQLIGRRPKSAQDGADAKGWYVSLSRARSAMHVYTRDKAALRQSVMYPGQRKSVWDLVQALRRSKLLSRDRMMPDLWARRQAEIVREVGMER